MLSIRSRRNAVAFLAVAALGTGITASSASAATTASSAPTNAILIGLLLPAVHTTQPTDGLLLPAVQKVR